MRCFISLDLSLECREEIKKIQDLIRKKNIFLGKFTEFENLHLTLKFLGELSSEQVEEVKKRLARVKMQSFYSELGGIGVFSKKLVRIIWIKLNSAAIWNLQKQIDECLEGLFENEIRFMSHITIARVKKVYNKQEFFEYLESIFPKPVKFLVKNFVLRDSQLLFEGPIYSDIGEYSLD